MEMELLLDPQDIVPLPILVKPGQVHFPFNRLHQLTPNVGLKQWRFFVGTNPGAPVNDGLIRKNGTTWTQFTNMIQIGDIKFANEQIGFAAVGNSTYPGNMWKTIDGGATWTELTSFIYGRVSEIQIVNPNKIYVRNTVPEKLGCYHRWWPNLE